MWQLLEDATAKNLVLWQMIAGAIVLVAVLLAVGKVPLSYNVRNLTVRWRTTILTALAFTLVVSLLVVMLAFVNGMRRLTEGTGVPGNVLVLADGATDETFSNLAIGELTEIESLPQVLRDSGRPMASRESYLIVNQPVADPQPGKTKRRFLPIRGVMEPVLAAKVHGLDLLPGGQWFSQAGVREAPGGARSGPPLIEAVLGEGIARELAGDRTPEQNAAARNPQRLDPGDTFALGNRTWLVVGVLASSGSTFNSEIWAKQALVGPIFGKENFTTLVVRTEDAETAHRLKDFLNQEYKKAAVDAFVETDYYEDLNETNQQFLVAIIFVTLVMSVGGVFGVMNTMFAAISQRTKDIGVLRLLGYSRGHILVSFLLESLVIGLLGGLLGCAVGMLADGWTATSVVSGQSGGGKLVVLTLAVDASTLAKGILVTLVMSGLGGLLPAWSAIHLRALDALR